MDIYKILKEIVDKTDKSLKAGKYSKNIYLALFDAGFSVRKEVRVPSRGDGKAGRIDMVANRDGVSVAIEIDWHTPRKKSLYKLKNYPSDYRVVVLRESGHVMFLDEKEEGMENSYSRQTI